MRESSRTPFNLTSVFFAKICVSCMLMWLVQGNIAGLWLALSVNLAIHSYCGSFMVVVFSYGFERFDLVTCTHWVLSNVEV